MEADYAQSTSFEEHAANIEHVAPKPQNCPITRRTSRSRFIFLGTLASLLLLMGLPTRAQEDLSKKQNQILSCQSAFN